MDHFIKLSYAMRERRAPQTTGDNQGVPAAGIAAFLQWARGIDGIVAVGMTGVQEFVRRVHEACQRVSTGNEEPLRTHIRADVLTVYYYRLEGCYRPVTVAMFTLHEVHGWLKRNSLQRCHKDNNNKH